MIVDQENKIKILVSYLAYRRSWQLSCEYTYRNTDPKWWNMWCSHPNLSDALTHAFSVYKSNAEHHPSYIVVERDNDCVTIDEPCDAALVQLKLQFGELT